MVTTINAEEQGAKIFATTSRKDFTNELKRIARIAGPMIAVMALQYLQQTVSIVIVGHISQLALTTVGIATALTNVTGYSVLYGMTGGLSTLCGQAYGAGQYKKLGTYAYSGIISLFLMCPPICLLWAFTGRLLRVTGQDPVVADGARDFCLWSVIGLAGTAVVGPLTRFLQAQSVVVPMLLASAIAFCLHALMSWILAFKVRMGDASVAVAFGMSTWVNAAALAIFVKFSGKFKETRAPFTWSAFGCIPEFLRLGLPAAVMPEMVVYGGTDSTFRPSSRSSIADIGSLGESDNDYVAFDNPIESRSCSQYAGSERARSREPEISKISSSGGGVHCSGGIIDSEYCSVLCKRCGGLCLQQRHSSCEAHFDHHSTNLRIHRHGQPPRSPLWDSNRLRVAESWSVHEHRSILLGWASTGPIPWIFSSSEKYWVLDRDSCRVSGSSFSSLHLHLFPRLEQAGNQGKGEGKW